MRKLNYVSDGRATIALQGIRFVKCSDMAWSTGARYSIQVSYKGHLLDVDYREDREGRDAMYRTLVAALVPADAKEGR